MGLFSWKRGKDQKEDFVDLDEYNKKKLQIKVVTMNASEDAKKAISSLTSNAVTLINIRPLRQSNLTELKRSLEDLKKAASVFEGDLAALSQDMLVLTPKDIEIFRRNKRDDAPRPRPEDIIPQREEY